jgi:hypothetical protein
LGAPNLIANAQGEYAMNGENEGWDSEPRRPNIWDNPFFLVGSSALILLIILGVTLWISLTRPIPTQLPTPSETETTVDGLAPDSSSD